MDDAESKGVSRCSTRLYEFNWPKAMPLQPSARREAQTFINAMGWPMCGHVVRSMTYSIAVAIADARISQFRFTALAQKAVF